MTAFSYSEEEIKILKNFADINPNIIINPDKFHIVNGSHKSVVGLYSFKGKYGYEPYGIYNLKEFLSGISQFNDAQLEIHDRYIAIKDPNNNVTTKYSSTDIDLITPAQDPSNKFSKLECDLEFTLTAEKMALIKKVMQIYNCKRIYFETLDKETIRLTTAGINLQSSTNPTEIIVNGEDVIISALSEDIVIYIKSEEFNLLEGDYNVKVAAKGISQWKNIIVDSLMYYIGISNIEDD